MQTELISKITNEKKDLGYLDLDIVFPIMDYPISVNSFRENYSFFNLALCTVTNLWWQCGNYSRAEAIRGNTVDKNVWISGPKMPNVCYENKYTKRSSNTLLR